MPARIIRKVYRYITDSLITPRAQRSSYIVACRVIPFRQRPVKGRIRFITDDVNSRIRIGTYRNVAALTLNKALDPIEQFIGCLLTEVLILPKHLIVSVLSYRKFKTAPGLEPLTTSVALTYTMVVSAIVISMIANHIEKHTIKRIPLDCLAKYLEKIFLLVAAINARVHLAVVIDKFAFNAFIKPFRMLGGNCLVDLAEIEATYNADTISLQPFD